MHWGEVQEAGVTHGFGPHVPRYREAISRADARLGRLLEAVRERMERAPHEDWLVAVTNAGGGTKREDMPPSLAQAQGIAEFRRTDGASSKKAMEGAAQQQPQQQPPGAFGLPGVPQHENTFLLLSGRTVVTGEILPVSRITDVVPTVLSHFGVVPRGDWRLAGRALPCVTGPGGWERLFQEQEQNQEQEPHAQGQRRGLRLCKCSRRHQPPRVLSACARPHRQSLSALLVLSVPARCVRCFSLQGGGRGW